MRLSVLHPAALYEMVAAAHPARMVIPLVAPVPAEIALGQPGRAARPRKAGTFKQKARVQAKRIAKRRNRRR